MIARALVVDDEVLARARIVRLLAESPDVEVIGEASGGREALAAIRAKDPDLVFLDVQMPDMDGFEVLRALGTRDLPAIVFVTAYDRYALEAFEASAVDYVMKPFERGRFTQAVERALRWIGTKPSGAPDSRVELLLAQLLEQEPREPAVHRLERFLVRRGKKTQFIESNSVDWIEAEGNYLRLHVGKASHLVRGTVNDCIRRLDAHQFVRIHRRYVVNMDQIEEVQPWFGGDCIVKLRTGAKLRLSRTFREAFEATMLGS